MEKNTSKAMRLDRYLVSTGKISRADAGRAARGGRILVNGTVEKRADRHIDPQVDRVVLDGEEIVYRRYVYILLNKPQGYVSATEDGDAPTVLTLLPPEQQKQELFPCGRLDKYTTGLMLLTNDGSLAHYLLSPKHHVTKSYAYTCRAPLTEADRQALEAGVPIGEGYTTKPAKLQTAPDGLSGIIFLTEGKYHQIKRMFDAVGNKIETLERRTFGPLTLPADLARGAWRYLTTDEEAALRALREDEA